MLHPLLVNALIYPSIASNLMTLASLNPKLDSVYTHNCSTLSRKPPLEVIQDGRNRSTNKLLASVKYLWVLSTPLSVA